MGLTQNTVSTIYEYLYNLGRLIGTKTRPIVSSDISLDIARGKIEGSEPISAYGKKVAAGADSGVIWADGVWMPPPAIGARISVVSTSASDGVGGTGVRSVDLHCLNANLEPYVETVILNGTTPVLTTATNIRFIQCAHMLTFGTNKKAAGTITFKDATTAQIYNQIDIGEVRCSSSARMVPKGKRLVLRGVVGSSISGNAQTSALVGVVSSMFDGHDFTSSGALVPISMIGIQDGSQSFVLPVSPIFKAGAIVAMIFSVDKAATVTGDWFGWLENDV